MAFFLVWKVSHTPEAPTPQPEECLPGDCPVILGDLTHCPERVNQRGPSPPYLEFRRSQGQTEAPGTRRAKVDLEVGGWWPAELLLFKLELSTSEKLGKPPL